MSDESSEKLRQIFLQSFIRHAMSHASRINSSEELVGSTKRTVIVAITGLVDIAKGIGEQTVDFEVVGNFGVLATEKVIQTLADKMRTENKGVS